MKVELLSHTPAAEEVIELAARTCYDSKSGSKERRDKFLQGIIKSGHTSVIEHASASFRISGVSRALTHELVRHRIGFSYSQRSQRYCSEDGFQYVTPDSIQNHSRTSFETFNNVMKECEKAYKELIGIGIPKEDARFVLPNACCTEIVVTANFRAWRNFLSLRLDKRAQWEIRFLARKILEHLYELAPAIFVDLYSTYISVPAALGKEPNNE